VAATGPRAHRRRVLRGGTAAVFVTLNGTGAAVLITFGGILLVLALLGDRIDSFEFGGTRLRLRAAADRLAAAAESERQGDAETAMRLRDEAQSLLAGAGPFASGYRMTRDAMRPGVERTMALDMIVAGAGQLAAEREFDPEAVAGWLRSGSEEERVTALAMMRARPDLRDLEGVLAAIRQPRTPFEQFQAMQVARQMLGDLSPAQRQLLAAVLTSQRGWRFRHDASRSQLSDDILAEIGARQDDREP
jgi:hypothetical protein